MDTKLNEHPSSDFAELDKLFGQNDDEIRQAEQIVLSQNLDGFASCFPDWDLHPPVNL